MYNIEDLKAFVAVIDKQGITAAAKHLNLAAATVSHRISKLEKHLGVQLIHRDSRHFSSTSEGDIFYRRILITLASIEEAESAIGLGESSIKGNISLTLPPWVLAKYIIPNLQQFLSTYPDISIQFYSTDRMTNIIEEGIDAAIRVGQLADSNLLAQKLADNDRILCASPDYLMRYGTPDSPEILVQHNWVCLPWQDTWVVKDKSGNALPVKGNRRVTVSDSNSLTESAIAGLGVTIKSRLAICEALAEGTLVEVMPKQLFNEKAPVWLLRAPQGTRSRKLALFFEFIKSAFQNTPY
ncbi:LysR family transcriptional regulator [Parasalinivibrio latis]|uniref:LysR family transcriptional regulator n=1 Tax=Parasalinivibrio latis TaxID=2952610 RepID=UPI0030E5C55A